MCNAVFGGREHHVSVRRRPHLAAFLERVAALFEVVVFTASQKVRFACRRRSTCLSGCRQCVMVCSLGRP